MRKQKSYYAGALHFFPRKSNSLVGQKGWEASWENITLGRLIYTVHFQLLTCIVGLFTCWITPALLTLIRVARVLRHHTSFVTQTIYILTGSAIFCEKVKHFSFHYSFISNLKLNLSVNFFPGTLMKWNLFEFLFIT